MLYWVILYLTGLNYYVLLKPFFPPYIDVYVFAMWFYITSGTKKSDETILICFLEQFKHAESKKQRDVTAANMARAVGASPAPEPRRRFLSTRRV